MSGYYGQRMGLPIGSRLGARPYPDLWGAFASEPEIFDRLEDGIGFEDLTEASRLLATRGIEASRYFLQQRLGIKGTGEQAVAPERDAPWHLGEFPEHLLNTDHLGGEQ